MKQPLPAAVRHDPLFRLAGIGGGRWVLAAAIVALNAVTLVVLPKVWSAPQQALTDLDVVGRATWALVGVPVALFLYFWVPIAISTLIPELRSNGALVDRADGDAVVPARRGLSGVEEPDTGLDALAAKIDARMDSRVWPVAGVIAVAGSLALEVPTLGSASSSTRALTVLELVGTATPVYAGTVLILRLVFGMVATTRSIGRAEPRVIPAHADDAGGWGGFGRRFFVLALAAVLYGVVGIVVNAAAIASGTDPSKSPASLITLAYFVVLPPMVVGAWFYAPHQAMLKARSAALAPLSRAVEHAALAGLEPADSGDDPVAVVRAGSDRLTELERRRELLVRAYPVWPLRLVELRTVWATAFLPVVTAVVTAVAGIVARWLAPPPPP
ncbi:MAG: hypothetical protein LC798_05810 [Chloroflexi bacterium]|nr:hypothetical protein [Chloroflexota bacterium]